jgi:hypothetical protein
VAKELAISDHTYYRWRREYGGIRTEQAKRLKMLEKLIVPFYRAQGRSGWRLDCHVAREVHSRRGLGMKRVELRAVSIGEAGREQGEEVVRPTVKPSLAVLG